MQTQPQSKPDLTTERCTIRFVGDPVGADLLVFFLREEGLQVDTEPPRERRVFEGEVSVTAVVRVSMELAEYLSTDAIKAAAQKAIDKVARRIPRVDISIEDNEAT